jgi:hypothetical protein
MDHGAVRFGGSASVTRVVLLPLDDRPVNYDHPWWIGRAAGLEVRRPPREWLGNPVRAAARDRLADWLGDEGPAADALVVAIDTLAYGGLIPSRQGDEPVESVARRLEPLRAIREVHPSLLILVASVLMRVHRSNGAEEEKPYWADHGRDLFRLSYLDDKWALGDASAAELAEKAVLTTVIPDRIVADYQAGRARNRAINELVLDWTAEGLIDYALIAQDDTAPYGWNIAEARAHRDRIRRDGLNDRATVYPGADEVGSLLVAAVACRGANLRPQVWPRYSGVDGRAALTAYEDRPVEELLKAHLGPLRGSLADVPDDADIILAVNAPVGAQADAWLQSVVRSGGETMVGFPGEPEALRAVQLEMSTVRRDIDEFVRAIASDVARERNVAVIDIAFVNGADLALGERLLATVPLSQLAAFSAWNTAGNSLGSGLAQAVVRAIGRRGVSEDDAFVAHLSLLFVHLLDDYAFQGITRTQLLLEDLPQLGVTPSFDRLPENLVLAVEDRLERRLGAYVESVGANFAAHSLGGSKRQLASLSIDPPRLPWQRLFEVAIEPHLELA